MSCAAESAGRFAREALAAGRGVVCAVFRRSCYLRCPGERYACVGDATLGRGPLNALVPGFEVPPLGSALSVELASAAAWSPPAAAYVGACNVAGLADAAKARLPQEGLGALVAGQHNSLAIHAQPALEALDAWLVGNSLAPEAERLIGLGPGLTPSGDDYLGGMLIALRLCGRAPQADSLWRWLQPRLVARTSAISAAHLAAAAAGEGHEALHACLQGLFEGTNDWAARLDALDRVGHCSGWDALAGAVAVARRA